MNRPDRPLDDVDSRRVPDPAGDQDRRADPQEREAGANSEQVTDEATLREDPSPPGQDPEDHAPPGGDA